MFQEEFISVSADLAGTYFNTKIEKRLESVISIMELKDLNNSDS